MFVPQGKGNICCVGCNSDSCTNRCKSADTCSDKKEAPDNGNEINQTASVTSNS